VRSAWQRGGAPAAALGAELPKAGRSKARAGRTSSGVVGEARAAARQGLGTSRGAGGAQLGEPASRNSRVFIAFPPPRDLLRRSGRFWCVGFASGYWDGDRLGF
jgi:hypothetical protein